MTEAANARLCADGWTIMDDDGFINLVGPLWHRMVGAAPEYAILGQDKHRNRRGVVQGGVLMTLADRTCGMTARFVSGAESLATIQMDTHFIDAARIGDLMISRPHAVRTTKSLIFMTTQVSVDERLVATSHGVFKVMRDRIHPAHAHVS
ncbi:PaaI family thioesterase [Rhodopseudomonas sp. P2A-2r]|uniref:PaaI family thioesterase n=1 Tax=Rhodopseudomonas sp. P2A-2r TaxID=2991972 RepID=UPI002234A650|nr:PaaI family thioesterase [Rhodopseudomonas sp. P2A-2r]UZE50099.1 PaaI family thioesterase [Rhodopseudomonas sp. P2A-2r]